MHRVDRGKPCSANNRADRGRQRFCPGMHMQDRRCRIEIGEKLAEPACGCRVPQGLREEPHLRLGGRNVRLAETDGFDAVFRQSRVCGTASREISHAMPPPRETDGAVDRDFRLAAIDKGVIGNDDDMHGPALSRPSGRFAAARSERGKARFSATAFFCRRMPYKSGTKPRHGGRGSMDLPNNRHRPCATGGRGNRRRAGPPACGRDL